MLYSIQEPYQLTKDLQLREHPVSHPKDTMMAAIVDPSSLNAYPV